MNRARKPGWSGGGGYGGGGGDGRGGIARLGGWGRWVLLWRGGCAQSSHFSQQLLKIMPDFHKRLQLRFYLVEAAGHLLLECRDAAIHPCEDSGRGGFFPLRVGKLERDLTLAGHRHQLLFCQVLLSR